MPHSDRRIPWRIVSVAAFGVLLLLYATGVGSCTLATGGWRAWTVFLLASIVAWVVFPMMYVGMRAYFRNQDAEHNLSQMVAEVALRREAIDAARHQRHDLRHHRIVIADHLLHGHVDLALDYLERLDREADRTPTGNFIWCENDTINAILSGLSRLAKAKGVKFEVTANVEKTIGVPVIDLVVLVANLVENAINACRKRIVDSGERIVESGERIEDSGERIVESGERMVDSGERVGKVCVALRQRERTFGMTVTNPVPEGFELSDEGLPCKEVGVGLESVREVIERNRGELMYTLEGGVLTCQAMVRVSG